MTIYDDPNREAVGLAPIWTGAGEGDAFDPGQHTIAEVQDHIEDHPEDRARVLAAEEDGKNRTTLVDWLSED